MEPDYVKKYIDYYHSVNPIWQSVPTAPVGTVQTDTMVIPRRELSRTEFFNDFLMPQRMEGLLNAVVLLEEERQTVVTVQGQRQFEASDVELYKLLTPHLQRAVQINIKLARAELNQIASVETLNRLEEGVLFVDLDANVRFANRAAENFFASRDLRLNEGRLHASSAAETATLHAVIAKCAETGKGGLCPNAGGSRSELIRQWPAIISNIITALTRFGRLPIRRRREPSRRIRWSCPEGIWFEPSFSTTSCYRNKSKPFSTPLFWSKWDDKAW